MKRKNVQNKNGITISDSIVMSVKRKHANYRKPFSAAIALIGYVSIIMAFLGMFKFHYNSRAVAAAAVGFAVLYLALAVIGRKALWVYAGSAVLFVISAYKKSAKIAMGFKFIYNIIYKDAYHSKIEYYNGLKDKLEVPAVTTLFFFYIWLLAIVIFFFTICRPNPVLPLITTFPVLEIGMYNGIKVPVFWGILCIAFWLALLAMSTIDVGEYSGGQSGFVRKNDLFFPKRHMKLKVTERCGMFIVACVVAIAGCSYATLKLTHYKRSEKLDQKRRDITEAMNDFSFDNLAESLSNLGSAFGFDFEYENYKLGTVDHVRYKNVTDLKLTIKNYSGGAIYLRSNVRSIYKNNEWFKFPASTYNDKIFDDFDTYGIHPQDFSGQFIRLIDPSAVQATVWIKPSARKSKQLYAPYNTQNFGDIAYNSDLTIAPVAPQNGVSSYMFLQEGTEGIFQALINSQSGDTDHREVYSASEIRDPMWSKKILSYCQENNLISYDDFFPVDFDIPADKEYINQHGDILMTELLHNSYKDFVYNNYLTVPDNPKMNEVREAYKDIISKNDGSLESKIEVLYDIRGKMQQDCTYSLYPRKNPSNRDFVNYFLLENQKGYCTHYATAGVMLARMAGIPARYATGYVVVQKDIETASKRNADGTIEIDVKDNRSHAWAEVFIDGIGWIPFEFTAGYSSREINTEPTSAVTTTVQTTGATTAVTTRTTASNSSNSSNSTTTKIQTTSDQSNTVTTAGNGGFGHGNGKGFHIPNAVKDIFLVLLCILALIGFVLLRRYLILRIRDRKFNSGKAENKIRSMYSYAEKLLETKKLKSDHGNYKTFAKEIENGFAGIYFKKGNFEKLTDIALRTCFGKGEPTEDELKLCNDTIDSISETIFNRADIWHKFIYKYINVLR